MKFYKFGIIDTLDKEKDYSEYNISEDNSVSVSNELIVDITKYLKNLKTYHNSFNEEMKGICDSGVTIIPPNSLILLNDVITTINKFKKTMELANLASLILRAKKENKHLICTKVL